MMSRTAPIMGVGIWLTSVVLCFIFLMSYESTAGQAANAPARLPEGASLEPGEGRFSLVVFLHPRCPCSRATISEVRRLMSRTNNLTTSVFLLSPDSSDSEWDNTSITRSIRGIPGVIVHTDKDGSTAMRFGARTSGETLLYDPSGNRVFAGGISIGRGQEGKSPGAEAILSIINHEKPQSNTTPVFGCSLLDDPDPNRELRQVWQ